MARKRNPYDAFTVNGIRIQVDQLLRGAEVIAMTAGGRVVRRYSGNWNGQILKGVKIVATSKSNFEKLKRRLTGSLETSPLGTLASTGGARAVNSAALRGVKR